MKVDFKKLTELYRRDPEKLEMLLDTLKRVNKIVQQLVGDDLEDILKKANFNLLTEDSEKRLYKRLQELDAVSIEELLDLSEIVAKFFDDVMIDVDDKPLRATRIALLEMVREKGEVLLA